MDSKWLILNFFLLTFQNAKCGKPLGSAKRKGPNVASWIRVHSDLDTYSLNVTTAACNGGGWLPDSIHVDCVCLRGIWAISTDLCDLNTTIYTGDGHCFQINQKIRKLFSLDIEKSRPFISANYLLNSKGDQFKPITLDYLLADDEEFAYIFRVNPKHPMIQRNYDTYTHEFTNLKCMPSVRREFQMGKTKQIYVSETGGRNRFSLGVPGNCPRERTARFWTLTVGESFRLSDQQISEGKPGSVDRCPATRTLSLKKKKDEDAFYYFTSKRSPESRARLHLNGSNTPQTAPADKQVFEELEFRSRTRSALDYNFVEDKKFPIEGSDKAQIALLNVQTKRLGAYYEGWIFYYRKGPVVTHVKEWAYVQLARKILYKTCKAAALNITDINNIFRWFRWIWRESLDVYSFVQGSVRPDQHNKIMEALNQCYAQGKPFTLKYKNECGPLQIAYVEADGNNYTAEEGVLPADFRYDLSAYEASLEFVYKLLMHTHHYCADYFVAYPTEHSTLNVVFESVFNPLLRLRWKNPGATVNVMSAIWPTTKLTPMFDALDTCVGISRSMSQYKELMERPVDEDIPISMASLLFPRLQPLNQVVRSKRSTEKRTLWKQLGYCVEEPNDVKGRFRVSEAACEE